MHSEHIRAVLLRFRNLLKNKLKVYGCHTYASLSNCYNCYICHIFTPFLARTGKVIRFKLRGHSLKQVDKNLASMMLSSCFVKVALTCGAEDAELLAKELNINPGEIQKLKPYEAYIGIGKKSHKVLMFPEVEMAEYKPEPQVKVEELDFLGEGWIYC